MLHDSAPTSQPATPEASAAPGGERLPAGVWRSGRRICAGIKVGRGRKCWLGKFPDVASAAAAVAYAVRLRDARRAAGQPVTPGELRGGPAIAGEVDVFALPARPRPHRRRNRTAAGEAPPPSTAAPVNADSRPTPQADAA